MRTSSAEPRQPLPKGYWTIWTTVALDLVGFGIVVPILGVYAERYGASGFEVGWLFAAFSLAQFVMAPVLGRLSDRIGRKPVIVLSLVGTAVGSLVTGFAGSLWLLFVGRALDGASGASLSVAQAAVADIAPPDRRPQMVGMLGAAFGVGFVLGPAIGGLAALGGPQVPFFVAAAIAAANAVAAWVRLPETRVATHPTPQQSSVGRFATVTPVLRQLAVVGFLATFAFVAFETTFSLFGSARFDLTEGSASLAFLGIGLVLVVVQGTLFGAVSAKIGVERLYRSGLLLVVVGLAVLATANSWGVLVVALLLLSIGQGVASPAITELVHRFSPTARRGEAMGVQQSAGAVARIAGPPIAGAMFDGVGVWSPMVMGSVISAVAFVVVVSTRRPANEAATT